MKAQTLTIFDCDGVLIDSEGLATQALIAELLEHGIRLTLQEALHALTGLNAADTAKWLLAYFDFKIPENFWDRVRARRQCLYSKDLKPTEGIFDLLDTIGPKCVASSSSPASLEYSLSLVGLWQKFVPHIFSSTLVKNGKPAPDIFLFAAKQMQFSPQECIVIEDSIAGIKAAKAANMRVIGYTGGSHCSDGHIARMENESVERIFNTHTEIKAFLQTA